jgi:hypothetical protein
MAKQSWKKRNNIPRLKSRVQRLLLKRLKGRKRKKSQKQSNTWLR